MSPIFSYRFDTNADEDGIIQDVLLIFFASGLIEIEPLAQLIEEEIETNLVPDHVSIIVRDPAFEKAVEAFRTNSLSVATFDRLGGRSSVSVASYDYHGKEQRQELILGVEPVKKISFSELQRRGMTHIFQKRGGFVEATSTYHFENPSGRHTQKFIRLSNILTRGAEIAFIGFCTLPHIPDKVAIAYLDTPSLYGIIAAINEQRASFSPPPSPILADNFGSYAGLSDYPFERQEEALVLISASSSGSMAADFISAFGFDSKNVVHLLFLGNNKSAAASVCDLSFDEQANPGGYKVFPLVEREIDCGLCASGSVPVKLHGDQFDIAGPQSPALLINKSDAPKGLSDLMKRNAGKQLFTLGLDRPGKLLLRQFSINIDALVQHDKFQDSMKYVMRQAVPAGLSHIIPVDERSDVFAAQIADHIAQFGTRPKIIDRKSLECLKDDPQNAILVAAAVIESGRSLLDISRDLRSHARGTPIIYLVGLAKTTNEIRRETLERSLVQTDQPIKHGYYEIGRIVLPASQKSHAWSDELALLIDPDVTDLASPDTLSIIDQRVQRLRQQSLAMTDELFISNGVGRSLKLEPGFVFWPDATGRGAHSQADVFYTIASVLQQLRSNAERVGEMAAIKSNWFQQTILAPGNFGRFNDDIIQASLLRAANPFELNYTSSPTDSQELARLIRRIVDAADYDRGGAAAEFLLAIACRRLSLCTHDIEHLLKNATSQQPMVSFLLDVCEYRLSG